MVITLSKGKNLYLLHKVPLIEVSVSIRHLAIMLRSGLALEDAVKIVTKQAGDPKLQEAFNDILKEIEAGKSMSEGMKKYPDIFSQIIVSIVSVGEQGANLENNLLFLAEYLKKVYTLQRKIKGALFYPMIILGIAFVEMIGIVFFFLPRLDSLYATLEDPPKFSIMVIDGAAFIRENAAVIGLIFIALIILYNVFLRTRYGKLYKEWLSLHFPIIKDLNKKNILLSFSRTLSLLLKSGIPIQEGLKITKETIGNYFYGRALDEVYEKTTGGENLADALAKYEKLFPLNYTKMIEIGEQTGALEENLLYLYDYYSEEVDEMTSNLTTLLEPLMLVFVAVLIVFLAISIIAPLYQLTGSING